MGQGNCSDGLGGVGGLRRQAARRGSRRAAGASGGGVLLAVPAARGLSDERSGAVLLRPSHADLGPPGLADPVALHVVVPVQTGPRRFEDGETIPLLLTLRARTAQVEEADPLIEDDPAHDVYSFCALGGRCVRRSTLPEHNSPPQPACLQWASHLALLLC